MMEAYRRGLGVKDAQKHINTFSSQRYLFDRRIPEDVAAQFDG